CRPVAWEGDDAPANRTHHGHPPRAGRGRQGWKRSARATGEVHTPHAERFPPRLHRGHGRPHQRHGSRRRQATARRRSADARGGRGADPLCLGQSRPPQRFSARGARDPGQEGRLRVARDRRLSHRDPQLAGPDYRADGRQRRSQDSRTALHRGVLPMSWSWLMRFRQGTVLLVAVLGLTRSVGAAEPVTIEYWHINSPTFGGPAAKELVHLFEAKHPNIKVVEKFQPGVYTGLMQQLQVSLAAKRPPAVAQIGYNLTAYAAGQFPHVLLDKYRKSDHAFFQGIPDNIMALGVLGRNL